MSIANTQLTLVETYLGLLQNLSAENKLELISKLTNSMRHTKSKKGRDITALFGAFIPEKNAEELILEIKQARTFTRKRAKF